MSASPPVLMVHVVVLALALALVTHQAAAQGPRRLRPLRRLAAGPGPFRRALARTSSFGRRGGYDGAVQGQPLDDPDAAWPAPPDELQQLQPLRPQPVQTVQPVQPVRPVQPVQSVQPVQPAQLQPRIQQQSVQPQQQTLRQPLRQPTLPPLPSITFFLFTRDAPQSILLVGDDATLRASGFNAARQTKVLIHGFTSSVNKTMMTTIKDAYLLTMDVNVVSVDWSPLSAAPWYPAARANVDVVGPRVADLLDWLAGHGLSPASVHIVGHSLGAHVAGIAGARLRAGRVSRISGLDPARPGFRDVDLARRLDPTDAAMVDVIHTTAGFLGLEQPVGHMDFYPNRGVMSQPGCVTDIAGLCSHEKAFRIFRDSIGDVDFPAVGCDSMQSAMSGRCGGRAGVMGEHCAGTQPGIYYAVTR